MNRREAIKRTTLWTGAGLLAPGIFAALQSCANRDPELDWKPLVLTPEQVVQLDTLADTIVPQTNSPSASQVRVSEFIDLIMSDVITDDQSESVHHVLHQLEAFSKSRKAQSFTGLTPEECSDLVGFIDSAAFSDEQTDEMNPKFLTDYRYLKSLILMAYFTSEEGVKQNLEYVVIPGEFESCIDLPADGKIMVGNHM